MHHLRGRLPLGLAFGPLVAALLAGTPASARHELVIGCVGAGARAAIAAHQPLVERLAAGLEDLGYHGGRVVLAPTLAAMADRVRDGRVDLVLDGAAPSAFYMRVAAMRPIARTAEHGSASYRSLVVATRTSGIVSVEQLAGRRLALDDLRSTSGHAIPLALLHAHGLPLQQLADFRAEPPAGTVGYIFTGDGRTTIAWLLAGRIEAAALSDTNLDRWGGKLAGHIVTLAVSEPIPRQLVLVGPGVSDEIGRRIQAVLLELAATAEGRELLAQVDGMDGVAVPTEADLAAVEQIARQLATVDQLAEFGR